MSCTAQWMQSYETLRIQYKSGGLINGDQVGRHSRPWLSAVETAKDLQPGYLAADWSRPAISFK